MRKALRVPLRILLPCLVGFAVAAVLAIPAAADAPGWSTPAAVQQASNPGGVVSFADGSGNTTLVYPASTFDAATDSYTDGVFATSNQGGSWSSPLQITSGEQNPGSIVAASNPAGQAVVVWEDEVGETGGTYSSIRASVLGSDGTWGSAQTIAASQSYGCTVYTSSGPQQGTCYTTVGVPAVAIDDLGNVSITYTDQPTFGNLGPSGNQVDVSHLTAGGSSWTTSQVTPQGGSVSDPQIAYDGNDTPVLAWVDGSGSAPQVDATTEQSDGSWAKPTALQSNAGAATQVSVAQDGSGALVAWSSCNDPSTPSGAVQAAEEASGSWAAAQTIATVPSPTVSDTACPTGIKTATDGTGRALVGWFTSVSSSTFDNLSPVAVVRDGAGHWGAPADLDPSATVGQGSPALAFGADGSAYLAYAEVQPDQINAWPQAYQLMAETLPQGASSWSAPSVVDAPASSTISAPALTGAAAPMLAWTEEDPNNNASTMFVSTPTGGAGSGTTTTGTTTTDTTTTTATTTTATTTTTGSATTTTATGTTTTQTGSLGGGPTTTTSAGAGTGTATSSTTGTGSTTTAGPPGPGGSGGSPPPGVSTAQVGHMPKLTGSPLRQVATGLTSAGIKYQDLKEIDVTAAKGATIGQVVQQQPAAGTPIDNAINQLALVKVWVYVGPKHESGCPVKKFSSDLKGVSYTDLGDFLKHANCGKVSIDFKMGSGSASDGELSKLRVDGGHLTATVTCPSDGANGDLVAVWMPHPDGLTFDDKFKLHASGDVKQFVTVMVLQKGGWVGSDGKVHGQAVDGASVTLDPSGAGGSQSITHTTDSTGSASFALMTPRAGQIRVCMSFVGSNGGVAVGGSSRDVVSTAGDFTTADGHLMKYVKPGDWQDDGPAPLNGTLAEAAAGNPLAQFVSWIGSLFSGFNSAISQKAQGSGSPAQRLSSLASVNHVWLSDIDMYGPRGDANAQQAQVTGAPVIAVGGANLASGTGNGVIAAGGANVIAAGGANVIAAGGANFSGIAIGGGNVIAAGGANVIAAGGANVIAAGGANVIAAGGANVIAAGGANVIAAGGANVIAAGGAN